MKLLALQSAVYKDYVGIYFILKEFSLLILMDLTKSKHPEFNPSVYLKWLLSYEDVDLLPVIFTQVKAVAENEVFSFIK